MIDLVRIMKLIASNIIQKIIQIIEFDPTLLTRIYLNARKYPQRMGVRGLLISKSRPLIAGRLNHYLLPERYSIKFVKHFVVVNAVLNLSFSAISIAQYAETPSKKEKYVSPNIRSRISFG